MRIVSLARCDRHSAVGIVTVISLLLAPAPARCQISQATARFLTIVPDARGASLGGGGSVFSTGAMSTYYNPALLVTSRLISGEFNYRQYLPKLTNDLKLKNLFFSSNYKEMLYIGGGYGRLSYGETIHTDEYGQVLERFTAYDDAFGLWAALAFDDNNSFGVGIKYIRSRLGIFGAGGERGAGNVSTLAFDFGFLSHNHFPQMTWKNDNIQYPVIHRLFRPERSGGLSFGLSVTNVGKGLAYYNSDVTDPLPRTLRLGVGYQAIDSEPVGLQLTIDATKLLIDADDPFREEWREIVWSYGLETEYYYFLSFRIGWLLDRDAHERYGTIGFGIGPKWLGVDYSRVLGNESGWNRHADENSISIRCNISPERFLREK